MRAVVAAPESSALEERVAPAALAAPGPAAAVGAAGESERWTPPESFGLFRLGPELGCGGMGVVYRALNVSLGREVALKFIASAQSGSRVEEFFLNEARTLASFSHPNIVTLYSVGEVDGHPYIETELLQGWRLSDLPRPLPWPRVRELGLGLARGLAAAHRQHILHRDIKPSNAMATESGAVKLLDFGLAEHVDPDEPRGARDVPGTLLYMAPECVNRSPATERSDLYSLGALLFQLCADRPPRENARLGPGVNRDLAAIIERCIRSEPEERFASAELLAEALENLEVIKAVPANPYRGLATFEAEHQAFFFGRNADIQKVLDRLRGQPMVFVAAESGTGKSSLCRAGILPRAAAGQLVEGRHFTTVTVSPGRRPLEALASALAPIFSRKETDLFSELADDAEQLGRRLRDGFRERGGLLLLVDQLEELVTLSDSAQRDAFSRALGKLALPSPAVRLLLAVRGDFFTRVAALPGLGDESEQALYVLRPMPVEALREAIVAPARACGVSFEHEALVNHLVDATARDASGLPLLSFALAELWERRDRAGARITRTALDALGGVTGMLSRHADGVVAHLTEPQIGEARRQLLRLITPERTRIERDGDELGVEHTGAQVALKTLVDGRLLQARFEGGRVLYQIAHDSLIHGWEKLRGWLDDDVGQAAVRRRLETAAAEWRRIDQAPEALWPKRQLDEARGLDPTTLNTGEREFIRVSRARVKRRWWLRRLGAALPVLVVAAAYGTFLILRWREEQSLVTRRLDAALGRLEAARGLAQDACARRVEALGLFDAPGSRWDAAEERWAGALRRRKEASDAFREAERLLQSVLDRQYRSEDTRQMLRDTAYGDLELAECFHPQGRSADPVRQILERFDDPAWRERVETPAHLELVTDPPGANVEVERVGGQGGWEPARPVASLAGLALPPGSYRLRLAAPGRAPIVVPVLLDRLASRKLHVALPASVPEGFAYVAPGCFLMGSDDETRRQILTSSPLHEVCMGRGYLIGKTEITFGDWLKYLETLPPNAPPRYVLEALRQAPAGGITLQWRPLSGWMLSFHRVGSRIFAAWQGEPFRYPDRTRNKTGDWRQLPLSGISANDLGGYFAWLDRTRQVRGARLCSEQEWERAARGADARAFPGGGELSPGDANVDLTYGRQPQAFGPDPVGSHPASDSPYGLHDMAGNASEMTQDAEPGRIVLRGGGWYLTGRSAHTANREPGEPTMRSALVGARTCASYPLGLNTLDGTRAPGE